MTQTKPKVVWQHLRQADGGEAFITPKEGEAFGLPIDEAVSACISWDQHVRQFSRQVGDLLESLGRWLDEREAQIHRAYFCLETDGALFAVVSKDVRFDPSFEDALSELDLGIAQDEAFNLIKLRVIAIPFSSDETISSFLDPQRGCWVYTG